jgi:hypothetical protein
MGLVLHGMQRKGLNHQFKVAKAKLRDVLSKPAS